MHVTHVQVQEGPQLHEEDPLPLCLAPSQKGEEQVHFHLLQAEPQAPSSLGKDPQEGCELEVHQPHQIKKILNT